MVIWLNNIVFYLINEEDVHWFFIQVIVIWEISVNLDKLFLSISLKLLENSISEAFAWEG